MRVFLDVGGHLGETLAEVVHPRWRFDRIVVFEPSSRCWPALEALADGRVEICRFGLWHEDATLALHDPGAIGASVAAEKALTQVTEDCRFVDATEWFAANLTPDDTVFCKLNCEGAECDVLDRLHAGGELTKIDHLLVHFDVRKVPSMAHRAGPTERRLDESGVSWLEAEGILFGRSHARKTANWLAWCESTPLGRLRYSVVNRITFRARQRLYPLKQRLGRA
jgi:FkbM family methyltransferase